MLSLPHFKEVMPNNPHDPALHFELGELLTRVGQGELGVSWFHSALRQDPGYAPAHRALAEHYERVGDRERAASHRRQAGPTPRPDPPPKDPSQ